MKSFLILGLVFLLPSAFASYESCSELTRTSLGNISLVCEDPGTLVPGPNGTQVFARRNVFVNSQEIRLHGVMIQAADGRNTFSMGPNSLKPGVTLNDLVGLSGQALLDKLDPVLRIPDRINISDIRMGHVDVDEAALHSSESSLNPAPAAPSAPAFNCTYVSSENRRVKLTQFQPNGNRCQDTGCLPREIFICLATISCEGSPVYSTTCKSSPDGCPSVDECVADDSVTTPEEDQRIQNLSRGSNVSGQ